MLATFLSLEASSKLLGFTPCQVKWVILRGLFGCANNVLSVSAILAGAHIGSVGALLSVNTVVAALLGRLVLGEALGKLHILAVFFSLAGAILISDLDQVR